MKRVKVSGTKPESWRGRIVREIRAATKISVLGAGNALRGDDAAGLLVADILSTRLLPSPSPGPRLQVLKTFEVPENYTGAVRVFGPDLVIIVDAAVAGKKPGEIFVVDPASIASEDISTHRIPLSVLTRYLETEIGCRVLVIGMEPGKMDIGAALSNEARRAVRGLARTLCRALGESSGMKT